MKITLGSIPPLTVGCDRCDIGRATRFARHTYREENYQAGVIEWNMCDECLTREIESWSPFGDYAPERPKPFTHVPPVQPPKAPMAWPLSYRTPTSESGL